MAPRVEVRAGFLGFGSEDGVAAANVGEDRVGAAFGILQRDAVFFAGAAAIAVAGSFRQEAAEDAVLGVEYG